MGIYHINGIYHWLVLWWFNSDHIIGLMGFYGECHWLILWWFNGIRCGGFTLW